MHIITKPFIILINVVAIGIHNDKKITLQNLRKKFRTSIYVLNDESST